MECKFSYQNGKYASWNQKLSQKLIQQWAQELKINSARRRSLNPDSAAPKAPKTQQWLCAEGQSRNLLGLCLHKMDYTTTFKRTVQAISGSFPTACNLFRWGIKSQGTCPLGTCKEEETLAHLQC